MKKEHEIRITVRFPSDLIEKMRPVAKEDGRSLNAEIVYAVREFVSQKKKKGNNDAIKA